MPDAAIPFETFECTACGVTYETDWETPPGASGAPCLECGGRFCPPCVADQVARAVCHVRASSLLRAGGLICSVCVDRIRGGVVR